MKFIYLSTSWYFLTKKRAVFTYVSTTRDQGIIRVAAFVVVVVVVVVLVVVFATIFDILIF